MIYNSLRVNTIDFIYKGTEILDIFNLYDRVRKNHRYEHTQEGTTTLGR